MLYKYFSAPNVPVMISVTERQTNVTMTLIVDHYDINDYSQSKCAVTGLTAISPNFTASYNVTPTLHGLITVTIENLKPNTAYVTQVYALNSVGYSEGVQVVLQTKPPKHSHYSTFGNINNFEEIGADDQKNEAGLY